MYYRLTYRTAAAGHKVGDSILCASRPLDIGQTAGCEAMIACDENFEPQLCATILPFEDNEGWYIVRRSDYAEILVNGVPVDAAVALSNSTKITLGVAGMVTELRFDIHNDGVYDDISGIIYHKKKNIGFAVAAIIALSAIAITLVATLKTPASDLRHSNLDKYATSVYSIVTDSVFLTKDTLIDGTVSEIVLEAVALDEARSATCFLTTDGYLVTARHCIEPWIDDEHWDATSTTLPPAVRMAAIAEAAYRNGQGIKVWALCRIYDGQQTYKLRSTDFCTNYKRDLIIPLEFGDDTIFHRSIIPVAQRRDMELGDFAFVHQPGQKGALELATAEQLSEFDRQHNKDIALLGFPSNDNNTKSNVKMAFGNSQHLEYDAAGNPAGCIEMVADVNRGNSGGPVLARIGGAIRVIGIVSKSDMRASQGTFWAVPATEITRMIERKDYLDDDTVFYRR